MSLQQALNVVRLQHAFWQKELCRAPGDDLKDCEFFHQQCEDDIALFESELGIPLTHRTRSGLPRKRRSLSNARPRTIKLGERAKPNKAVHADRRTHPAS